MIQQVDVFKGCKFTSALPTFPPFPPPYPPSQHTQDDGVLPRGDPADQFKPVVPWPHVEGVEVDLNSIRLKHHGETAAPLIYVFISDSLKKKSPNSDANCNFRSLSSSYFLNSCDYINPKWRGKSRSDGSCVRCGAGF